MNPLPHNTFVHRKIIISIPYADLKRIGTGALALDESAINTVKDEFPDTMYITTTKNLQAVPRVVVGF